MSTHTDLEIAAYQQQLTDCLADQRRLMCENAALVKEIHDGQVIQCTRGIGQALASVREIVDWHTAPDEAYELLDVLRKAEDLAGKLLDKFVQPKADPEQHAE